MKTPHVHAELIKAWADGAEIEAYQGAGSWKHVSSPAWSMGTTYRIKPEPKPDVVTIDCVKLDDGEAMFSMLQNNLKLTWCGETGKLKSAEVL